MPVLIAVIAVIVVVAGVFLLGSSDENQTTNENDQNTAQVEVVVENDTNTNSNQPDTTVESETNVETESEPESQSNDYRDGSYTVDTSYRVPNGVVHDMAITFEIENDKFQDVSIIFDGKIGGSTANQQRFLNDLQVTGMDIDETNLARVGGASLTTDSFNNAVVTLRQQASVQ